MLPRHAVLLASIAALSGCAKPTPVEATLVDVTPGSEPVIKVHLKGKPNTFLTCNAGELTCTDVAIGASGTADTTLTIATGKKVPDAINFFAYTSQAHSGKPVQSVLDLKKTPRMLDTSIAVYGSTIGIGRRCDAIVSWGPLETFTMTVEPGASVEIDGIKTTSASGNISMPVKALAAKPFGDLPAEQTFVGDDAADRGSYPLKVTFADGTKLSATLHLKASMAKYHVEEFFKKIDKGPLLLPGEASTKPAGGAQAAYSVDAKKIVGKHVSALREVEYVETTTETGTRSFTCKYQSGATATLTMHDIEVKLYERRTGRVAFSHKLQAPQHCDDNVDHTVGTAMPPQSSYVAATDSDALVLKQLGH